jgi:prepilin-type N-terminal cleavage/methylation domain-containing protein
MIRLKQKGFTLIELMIVVAIIGILAAIAIPRFADMLEKSREGSTKGNLGSFKSAASIYYGDHEGQWPVEINAANNTAHRFSLYLEVIPPVKVTGKFDLNTLSTQNPAIQGQGVSLTTANVVPQVAFSGWLYDSTTGNVYVNSTLQDSKRYPYSYYGFE